MQADLRRRPHQVRPSRPGVVKRGAITQRCGVRSWVALAVMPALAMLLLAACSSRQEPDVAQLGEALYQANCAGCHGAQGEGQPDWQAKGTDGCYPAPPHDASGHTWHHSDGNLFRTVKYGASLNIPGFKSCMPAFEDKLKDDEIKAVLSHLRTLWGQREREFQAKLSEHDSVP